MKTMLSLLMMLFVCFGFGYTEHMEDVRIGVLSDQGISMVNYRWQPVAEYLNQIIDHHNTEIIALPFSGVVDAVKSNRIDFLFANPTLTVDMGARYNLTPILTQVSRHNDVNFSLMSTLIITQQDNGDIHTIYHARGKRIAAVSENSFGGWLAALKEFHDIGIDPEDFESLDFMGSHDGVIFAVQNGLADIGIVRAGTLTRLDELGALEYNNFRVLNYRAPTEQYPFMHSGEIYPAWALSRMPHMGDQVAIEYATALINIPSDVFSQRYADPLRFSIPSSYLSVEECLKALNVSPYDNY